MKDPSRPEHNFLVADAWAIFVKEIGYVQKGFLSDLPGMNMYVYQRTCARTGFIFYRSLFVCARGLPPAPPRRSASVRALI